MDNGDTIVHRRRSAAIEQVLELEHDRLVVESDTVNVPREPTEDMILAGMGPALGISFEAGGVRDDVIEIYRLMIAEAQSGQRSR